MVKNTKNKISVGQVIAAKARPAPLSAGKIMIRFTARNNRRRKKRQEK